MLNLTKTFKIYNILKCNSSARGLGQASRKTSMGMCEGNPKRHSLVFVLLTLMVLAISISAGTSLSVPGTNLSGDEGLVTSASVAQERVVGAVAAAGADDGCQRGGQILEALNRLCHSRCSEV